MAKYPYLELAPGAIWPTNKDLLVGLNATARRLAREQKRPGLKIRIVSGLRTYQQQVALYQAYLNGTGNLAARPGTSRHETGNAADCGVVGGWGPYVSLCEYPGAVAALRAKGLTAPVYSEAWHIESGGTHRYPRAVPKHPTIKKGSRGPAVYRVQRAIGVAADGSFGSATGRAVRAFQRKHGVPDDGIVGPTTWTHILKAENA